MAPSDEGAGKNLRFLTEGEKIQRRCLCYSLSYRLFASQKSTSLVRGRLGVVQTDSAPYHFVDTLKFPCGKHGNFCSNKQQPDEKGFLCHRRKAEKHDRDHIRQRQRYAEPLRDSILCYLVFLLIFCTRLFSFTFEI